MAFSAEDSASESSTSSQNVTLQDVARAAGVTLGTASKAMNGRGKLRPETRERVRAEARRLGFRFRMLEEESAVTHRVMVGVLTTDSYGRFSMPLMAGIEDAFGALPVTALLCNSRDLTREQQHLQLLLERKVDAIVVSARREDVRPPLDIRKASVPVIYAFSQVADPNALCVVPDDAQGARLAIEHLLQLGRRHFAHITGPSHFEAVRLRQQGMLEALAERDICLPEQHLLSGPWQESWGYTAARFLFDQGSSIDALFCGSDQLARGAIDALRERGIRVPDDVAVVGFDNWEPIACGAHPALTSVDMNLRDVGQYVGKSLLALFAGEQRSGLVRLPCSLIVRDSSGASH